MEQITPEKMPGLLGHVSMLPDEFMKLAPKIATVSNLAIQIRSEAKQVHEYSMRLIPEFGEIVRKYFCDKTFPIPGVIPEKDKDGV